MNLIIFDSYEKMKSVISQHQNIACSVSGGSDSDILIDMCVKCDVDKKIKYVYFETGLEYMATREHLTYLEQKYNIIIERHWAKVPIPLSTLRFGEPFLSKQVSEFMSRLQKHSFKWEDKPYEELIKEYPKCISALQWWCDKKGFRKNGKPSSFNISYNKWLKEFIICFKPTFKISNKCCQFAKKDVFKDYAKKNNITLSIIGVRRQEGGSRANSYNNCITLAKDEKDITNYRPIFWYSNQDKKEYVLDFNLTNSKCYTDYGLNRTGCVGCPYGLNLEFEKEVVKKYEPKMYKAINHIFKNSYEYTRLYQDFKKRMNNKKVI